MPEGRRSVTPCIWPVQAFSTEKASIPSRSDILTRSGPQSNYQLLPYMHEEGAIGSSRR